MRFFRSSAQSIRLVILTGLMAAVLLSQWIGLQHGIKHAGWQQHGAMAQAGTDNNSTDGTHHSCIAFDAATLADSAPVPACTALTIPGAQVLALWIAFASWDAPVTFYFSSRAPPG